MGKYPGIDTSISLTEVTGYWKSIFSSSQSVQPYGRVMGGLIVTKVSASAEVQGVEVSASVSESDFGIGAGFGVQFQSQGVVGGFTEFMLFTGFTEGDASTYIGIRGGVNFSFSTSPRSCLGGSPRTAREPPGHHLSWPRFLPCFQSPREPARRPGGT